MLFISVKQCCLLRWNNRRLCFHLRRRQVAAPTPVGDCVFTPLAGLKTLSYQGLWADRSDTNGLAQNAVVPRVLSNSTNILSRYCYNVISQYHYIIISLYHYIIISLYHYIIISQYRRNTISQWPYRTLAGSYTTLAFSKIRDQPCLIQS